MFRVGQKVVCVAGPMDVNSNPIEPVIGEIYTIRELFTSTHGYPGLRLVELKCPMHHSGVEYGLRAERFRPIVERKTDISIFKALLVPKNTKIDA